MELILLNIGYAELNADWNWKDVYSPFARIYYVKEGTARTCINGKIYDLTPGNIYLTPPFTLHNDECDSSFSLYYIHFYENTVNKESIFEKYNFPVEVKTSALDELLIKRLLEINPDRYLMYIDPQIYDTQSMFSRYIADSNKMSLWAKTETQGILSQLMARYFYYRTDKLGDTDERVGKALQYIHENIDKTIYIGDIAKISCLTKDYFIRIFKKEMKCTPVKYILMKKVERAQLLLLTSKLSVKDIAMELSIENISYFNRLFKQHTGKTPSRYRDEYL